MTIRAFKDFMDATARHKRYPFGIGNRAYNNIGDILNVLGWSSPETPARRAWQREAAMTERERKAAFEARMKESK